VCNTLLLNIVEYECIVIISHFPSVQTFRIVHEVIVTMHVDNNNYSQVGNLGYSCVRDFMIIIRKRVKFNGTTARDCRIYIKIIQLYQYDSLRLFRIGPWSTKYYTKNIRVVLPTVILVCACVYCSVMVNYQQHLGILRKIYTKIINE
jgi:hypothetical protein